MFNLRKIILSRIRKEVRKLTIPIKVMGFSAEITDIVAAREEIPRYSFAVIVKFDPPAHGIITFGPRILAKHYTKDELIAEVVKEAEKILRDHIKEAKRDEEERARQEMLEKFAVEVSREVGLKKEA